MTKNCISSPVPVPFERVTPSGSEQNAEERRLIVGPHIIELSLRKGVHLDVVGERTVPIFIVRFAERFVVDGNGSFVGDVVDDALLGGEGRVDRVDAVLIADGHLAFADHFIGFGLRGVDDLVEDT